MNEHQILGYARISTAGQNTYRQRQAEGIAAARARGVKFDRQRKDLPEDFDAWFVRWRRGELSNAKIAAHCDMEISVLYRKLRESGISLAVSEGIHR